MSGHHLHKSITNPVPVDQNISKSKSLTTILYVSLLVISAAFALLIVDEAKCDSAHKLE